MMKSIKKYLLCLFVLSFLPYCQSHAPEDQAAPLRVAIDLWPGYYPLIIADKNGYFTQEKVRVKIILPEDTDRMMADFAARTHDAVAVALGDLINVTRVNPDVHVIFISDESAGGDVLLGCEPFTDAEQVRGKRIGTNLGGFGELLIRRWMERYRIPPDSVTLINVDSASVPHMLAQGNIFAGHCWEPYVTRAREKGAVDWFSSKDTPGLIPDVVAFQGMVVRERSHEVQGFVRAWFKAVDWWIAHPQEGNRLTENYLRLPEASVSLKGIKLMTLEMNQKAFAPSETMASIYHTAGFYIDFFVARGTLSRPPAPSDLLNPRFLQ